METQAKLSYRSYCISDVGKARKLNEDSMLSALDKNLWVVADGMGGHSAGDVASQMIVNALQQIPAGLGLDALINEIEARLGEVNLSLINKASASGEKVTIGSTVVGILIFEHYCVYFWVGDSRLYRLREQSLRQMTVDHSQVEDYIELGIMTQEEALVHSHSNMITKAVGATPKFFVDMDIQEIKKGDRYLLCSDGLTRHIEDFELQELLNNGDDCETLGNQLIKLTLMRGARDNVTAILIDVD